MLCFGPLVVAACLPEGTICTGVEAVVMAACLSAAAPLLSAARFANSTRLVRLWAVEVCSVLDACAFGWLPGAMVLPFA